MAYFRFETLSLAAYQGVRYTHGMNPFAYKQNRLYCEDVDLTAIADQFGTPTYVYSANAIRKRFHEYEDALAGMPHQVCYAVKANSTLAVLSVLAREGAGFDIVSGGELFRVIKAGGDPAKVVFSGVGKTDAEIRYALENRIRSFNCESEAEIASISRIASESGAKAAIAIRVNPDIAGETHAYNSTGLSEHKFGIPIARAEEVYHWAVGLPGIAIEGVSCHIGSQFLTMEPVLDAAATVLALCLRLQGKGLPIHSIDVGGGLGVPYCSGETAVPIADFIARLRALLEGSGLTLLLEPGRSIVAEAGALLSRVVLVKQNEGKTFQVIDAAMNDLIRPTLYQAHHEIVPLVQVPDGARITADVVGPVCETGDFLAQKRDMAVLAAGDLVALQTAGAYGFVQSSNYNSRPRSCEILVDGDKVHVARVRESWEDLVRGEAIISG